MENNEENLKKEDDNLEEKSDSKECFVIMPIGDCEGYDKGHFTRVYKDLITPAVKESGYSPIRADDVRAANIIHIDILNRLLQAPIAVCDLSSRNPNVLFELGIRQAFDKPVVLIQEIDTPRIFDISSIRCIDYCKELKYHSVVKSQKDISRAINDTINLSDSEELSSLIKLLSINKPAELPKGEEGDFQRKIGMEIAELRYMMSSLLNSNNCTNTKTISYFKDKYIKIAHSISMLEKQGFDYDNALEEKIKHDIEEMQKNISTSEEFKMYIELENRLKRFISDNTLPF